MVASSGQQGIENPASVRASRLAPTLWACCLVHFQKSRMYAQILNAHLHPQPHVTDAGGLSGIFRCLVPNHRFIIGVTNIDLFLLLLSHFTSWVTSHLSAYPADIESSFSFFFSFLNSSQRFCAASVSSLFAYKPVSSTEAQSWLSKWKPLKFSFFN